MNLTQISRPNIDEFDLYPIFLDYDFVNKRPRGATSYIDLFASGELSALIENIPVNTVFFIKKSNIDPHKGFFLMDFSFLYKDISQLIKTINELKIKKVFIEKSKKYPLESHLPIGSDIEYVMVNFSHEC